MKNVQMKLFNSHLNHNVFSFYNRNFVFGKVYVVGTQKDCLNETVLLSTENKCSK